MKKYIAIAAGLLIIFSACVPRRNLLREQARVNELKGDSSSTHSKLDNCNTTLDNCNTKVASLEKDNTDLKSSMNDLSANYKSSTMTVAQQQKRLQDLEGLIQAQKDVLNKLKKTIADALINFKPDELSVYLKDGKLYVSLQEKLLFPSGSAVVNPKGKQALQTLATVLINTPNITVNVEGHTDTVPITGKYEDNWALSVARSTAVTRILTVDYGVNPHTIIASGRSKYYPIADNASPEGRARNRRTEIILSPDLTELFNLLNQ